MSYALVQEQTAAAGVDPSDLDCTLDAPPVAGRLIVVRALWSPTERVATITDTAGNDYALAALVSEDIEEGSATLGIFYAYACLTATPFTVTATLEAPGDAITLAVSEWSGRSSAADPLGDTDTLAIPPTAPPAPPYDLTVGTVTPSAAGDLILGAIMEWSLDADPPGSTPLATEGFLSGFYLLAPSAAAYAAAVSFSSVPSPMLGAVVVFRLVDQVWVPVPDFESPLIDAVRFPSGAGRVTCDLWTEDLGSPLPTITARLVSLRTTRDADGLLEIDAEVGRSATLQTAVPADATFAVTLAGIKRHRLEVTSDPPDVDLFCAPGAEVTR